jgi:N-acetylmuramoyl-L-alanine amidase
MKRLNSLIKTVGLALLTVALISCGTTRTVRRSSPAAASAMARWDAQLGAVPIERKTTPVGLLRETRLKQKLIPAGRLGRAVYRPMQARYITIHSTQNYIAGAEKHAQALLRGTLRAKKRKGGNRIGFMTWHFTVDDRVTIQHLPTNEQGEHADFDGPGNNYSIGIEMCEHRGNNIAVTIDRTAKLTAYLMYQKGIPLQNVVPHYHWPREGLKTPHKDCPHFLLENGRPGVRWRWFIQRVNGHYSRLVEGQTPRL